MNHSNLSPGSQGTDANVVFAAGRFSPPRLQTRPHGGRMPLSGLRFFIGESLAPALRNLTQSLRGRLDWHGHAFRRLFLAFKYLVRVGTLPLQHLRYLALVCADPRMQAYKRRDPRMLERHFHRYINLNWNRQFRLQSVHAHYRFALAHLPPALFEEIYAHGRASLGVLSLKDGSTLRLSLQPPISMGCEGELCIQLNDVNGRPIYRIVLSVINEQSTIVIGCIQGPDGENAKDMVRDLTRNLYGMRPKQLMLSLVYAFARHYGIERIWAVANAAHPLRRRGDKFQADYDSFWLEQKGMVDGDGWFELPETPSRKAESDVPSHHRSAFRRREAIRIEAERLLTEALGRASCTHATVLKKSELKVREPLQPVIPEASWIS